MNAQMPFAKGSLPGGEGKPVSVKYFSVWCTCPANTVDGITRIRLKDQERQYKKSKDSVTF